MGGSFFGVPGPPETAVWRGGFIRTEKEKNYLNFAAEKLLAKNPQPVILLTLRVATFALWNRKSFCPRRISVVVASNQSVACTIMSILELHCERYITSYL